ncbi:MAG: SDR family oxidoreductase [Pseudomonadota bacterium]
MAGRLENKIAFITGGNSGIGLEAAKTYAAEGATIILLARTQEKADQAIAQIGGTASAYIGDVSDLESLKAAFDGIAATHGRLDIVLASAGIAPPRPLSDADEAHFDTVFDVNVKGAFFTVKYALPLLRPGSSVILVSSSLSEMGMAGFSVYNASKAAIRSLARSLTLDLAEVGARINVLSPGPIKTEVLEKAGLTDEQIETQYAVFDKVLAAGRAGRPDEMAGPALFLASDESSYLYGTDLAGQLILAIQPQTLVGRICRRRLGSHLYPRVCSRNASMCLTVSAGCSCCSQWPEPSIRCVPR